jgi:hypothetical protein
MPSASRSRRSRHTPPEAGLRGEPGRDGRSRAVRPQIHDPRRRPLDQHGARAMTPPPGPRVDADLLSGGHGRYRSRSDQAEPGGRTGRPRQAGRQPGPGVPTEGRADGLQGFDQPTRVPRLRGDEVRQARRDDAAHTGRMAAHALPSQQLNPNGERTPGEVSEAAWVTAMEGRRGHRTARAARRGCRGRELELPRGVLNGHLGQVDGAGRWEQPCEKRSACIGPHL